MKKISCLFAAMLGISAVWAQAPFQKTSFMVGQFEVILLSEGQREGQPNILVGAKEEMLKECIPTGTYPSATNAFLIRTPEGWVLVDTGFGRNVMTDMAALGVAPADIKTILLTHMHGDHIGGMLREDARAFPNAKVFMAAEEHAYWMASGNSGAFQRKVIAAYESNLVLFSAQTIEEDNAEILPGIYGILAPGHTPGHSIFMLESLGNKMLIWGDLTHARAIQMAYPQVAVTYDTHPDIAIATRFEVLAYVAQHKIPVAGMHIPFPGMGTVKALGMGKYVFMADIAETEIPFVPAR